jgi:threonine synthase
LRGRSFNEVAYKVLSSFISNDDIPDADLKSIIAKSFSSFRTPGNFPYSSRIFEQQAYFLKHLIFNFIRGDSIN